jgi:hypothetical protein
MRSTDTPTLRYGHPAAAVIGGLLIVLNHTGVLDRLGLSQDMAFDIVTGSIAVAAIVFGSLDHRHGTKIAGQLKAVRSELEDNPPVSVPPEEDQTSRIETDAE